MGNVFRPEPKPEASGETTSRSGDRRYAWQPITFRGVAAFAHATYPRLFWVQVVFAVLCAVTIVWALAHSWAPVIRSAVRDLPNDPVERVEQLVYPASAPTVLAESRHLAVLLRPEGTASPADVRIEFQPTVTRVCSLFGCLLRPYPKGKAMHLTRQESIPWWDAWEPILLGIVAVVSALFFLTIWTVLPTLVFLGIRLYAYFADRQLNLGGAWRLSAAAFLPGTLALIAAVVLYALGIADLIRFLIAIPGHLLIALIYLWAAPLRVERIPTVPPPALNPFTEAPGPGKTSA